MPFNETTAWQALLALKGHFRNGAGGGSVAIGLSAAGAIDIRADRAAPLVVEPDGRWRASEDPNADVAQMFDLYLPLCASPPDSTIVIGHLGQSLDGRIATHSGESQFVNGQANILHLHRLRALCDAVLVGAGTVRHDDPQLTVRHCSGATSLRVVIDTNRSLDGHYRLFTDGAAPTLVFCAEDRMTGGERLGRAEIVGLPRRGDWLDSSALLAALAAREVRVLFVEGGGVTVSRFLAAGALTHLQVTVAPMIIGSGRPGIDLPRIDSLADALRPPTRRFLLGEDVMFECRLDGS